MQRRGGLDVLVITVLLIAITLVFAGAFFYWGNFYTQQITQETNEDTQTINDVEHVNIAIRNVQFDPLFSSDLIVTLENMGNIPIQKAIVTVTLADGTVFTDTFPKKEEYSSEVLNLQFFEVKQFTVFFESHDLSTYTTLRLVPLVDGGGNLRPVGVASKEWTASR